MGVIKGVLVSVIPSLVLWVGILLAVKYLSRIILAVFGN